MVESPANMRVVDGLRRLSRQSAPRPRTRGLTALVAVCVALAVSSCREPRGSVRPLTRLLPALEAPRFWPIDHETRPAIVLRPGDRRSCAADLRRGSRLRLSLGILRGAPRNGLLRFEVSAGGSTVFTTRLPTRPSPEWQSLAVPLPFDGPTRLELRADRLDSDGNPVPPETGEEAPRWIAVGSPRIEAPPGARRRVVVWISQDTVRADHLGAYGYGRTTSPNFDRLARRWVLFENGVSPASWTLPALASQFTSRYPTYHGAVLQRLSRSRADPTVFEVLAREGFAVLGVTGNEFVSPHFGLASGFDGLWDTTGNAADVNRLAMRALEEWNGGDLAFFVHYMDPHARYDPPPPFNRLFDPGYRGKTTGGNFEGLTPAADPADVEHVKALYDGELAYTDRMIGELLDALAAKGLLDDAVVVYSADHGEEFLDHGKWMHSRTLYEEMLHVPFALKVPGVPAARVAAVVSLVDVAPTVLDAFSIPSPASFQGRSLMPVLRGGGLPDQPVFAETERNPEGLQRVAVRSGRMKYLLATARGREIPPRVMNEELYDLQQDPAERTALSASPALEGLRREALAYLSRARAKARGGEAADVPPEVEQQLRALGYVR